MIHLLFKEIVAFVRKKSKFPLVSFLNIRGLHYVQTVSYMYNYDMYGIVIRHFCSEYTLLLYLARNTKPTVLFQKYISSLPMMLILLSILFHLF